MGKCCLLKVEVVCGGAAKQVRGKVAQVGLVAYKQNAGGWQVAADAVHTPGRGHSGKCPGAMGYGQAEGFCERGCSFQSPAGGTAQEQGWTHAVPGQKLGHEGGLLVAFRGKRPLVVGCSVVQGVGVA
jgi:hypothetical protein